MGDEVTTDIEGVPMINITPLLNYKYFLNY